MTADATAGPEPILAVCPECHSVVRIPAARADQQPRCPRCKAAVLDGRVASLSGEHFFTLVERSSLPVVVDFWAPWCGPCRMMAPVLERVAAQRATTLQVGKVNTDEEPALASRFGIRSIPTLILFLDGREIARQSGAVDAGTLTRWLDQALAR